MDSDGEKRNGWHHCFSNMGTEQEQYEEMLINAL